MKPTNQNERSAAQQPGQPGSGSKQSNDKGIGGQGLGGRDNKAQVNNNKPAQPGQRPNDKDQGHGGKKF